MFKKSIAILILLVTLISMSACSIPNFIKSAVQSPIIGKWVSEKGTLFEFSTDKRYGYYKDSKNTSDNYYKGPLRILSGQKALTDLNIDNDEYNRSINKLTGSKNNVFSIKMDMEILHSEGIDKSDTLDKKEYYYFVFYILADKNKAEVVNMNTMDTMEVTRVK